MAAFLMIDPQTCVYDNLMTIKQGKDKKVRVYYTRMLHLVNTIGPNGFDVKYRLTNFVRGLRSELHEFVIQCIAKTVDNAVRFTEARERSIEVTKASKKLSFLAPVSAQKEEGDETNTMKEKDEDKYCLMFEMQKKLADELIEINEALGELQSDLATQKAISRRRDEKGQIKEKSGPLHQGKNKKGEWKCFKCEEWMKDHIACDCPKKEMKSGKKAQPDARSSN